MRVLFLSDTHLGIDLPSHPRVARRRRGHDFFDNFERALAPALAGQVDVVVHGGDLLYRSRVPAWLVDAALAPLRRVASAGVPVVLLLGNHERSRLPYPLLAIHDGLYVFDRPRTVVIEAGGLRVAFSGFPYARNVRQRFRELLRQACEEGVTADARVLCMHQCVEGATCGPGDYVFRSGDEVVRTTHLPTDVAAILCGHIHRHQVLRPAGRPPVIYAGSIERTSFAEAPETKGYVVLSLEDGVLGTMEFTPLPARPMRTLTVDVHGLEQAPALDCVRAAIASTPDDAVVQVRMSGDLPEGLSAAALRGMSGSRNVTLSVPAWRAARRSGRGRDLSA